MTFTKEQAVERITAKFAKLNDGDKGIDLTRTISEAVSNGLDMLGEDSKIELDAFVGFIEKNVSSALGLARHERSKFSSDLQSQIDELQKQLKGNEPKPDKKDTEPSDPAMQKMLEKVEELELKLKTREEEESVAKKRNQLVEKMGESIKDKEWIDAFLSEVSVGNDTDVEAKAKDYVAFYNKTRAKGGKYTPKPTDDDTDENSAVKSVVSAAANYKKTLSYNRGGGNSHGAD